MANNDLDYTKKKEAPISPPQATLRTIASPRGSGEDNRVIRDPAPRIVSKDKYEEKVQQPVVVNPRKRLIKGSKITSRVEEEVHQEQLESIEREMELLK